MAYASIHPQDLHRKQAAGQVLDLVDVRTSREHASGHAVGARLLSLNRVTPDAVRSGRPPEATGPTYVICQSGGRSRQACQRLAQAGFTEVVNVEGGTASWRAAGLPVASASSGSHEGLPGWVRAAGMLLVLACLALAWALRPWFTFVGLGIWLALLIAGRGACPLNTCVAPPTMSGADKG